MGLAGWLELLQSQAQGILALAAEHRDPSTRTAKALHQADSTVTAVSRRAPRKAER